MRKYYVYILASKREVTLYVGMTNNLARQVGEHKQGPGPSFTQRYKGNILAYFEEFQDALDTIRRGKQLKWWRRKWKFELIESVNPTWKHLALEL